MSKKDKENAYTLTAELQNYRQQGISIWLGPWSGDLEDVSDAMEIREEISYIRD